MRRAVLLTIAAGSLAVLTACGPGATTAEPSGASPSTPAPASPSVATVAPTSSAVPAPVVATEASPTTASVNFKMPNFVGKDLQSAQDEVQTNGIFFSKSHDLLGTRHQILDSDWIVCSQNIPTGQHVTADIEGQIDFGVVKRYETCP